MIALLQRTPSSFKSVLPREGGECGGWVFLGIVDHNSSYVRPSEILPIDPARRELQNAIGEIEIGDFLIFYVFWPP